MLEGIAQAKKTGANLILADRKIEITLKRVWGYLGFWNKMKLFVQLLEGLFEHEQIDEDMIEKIKQADQLELAMAEFAGKFPEIKRRLLDERDIYLAESIRRSPGERIVAVVGAGHVPGIVENIQEVHELEPLTEVPPKSWIGKFLKWAIPALIVGLFVWVYFTGGFGELMKSIYIWFFVNGTLSAVGAAIALGHPLAVVSAFIAAPLTSLNPLLAAGWVAGLVQAWIRKPVVADFVSLL
ncbi:MAG: TraB family protein [Planctomycetota bacterium]|jgi:pheromone shutdown-related protein TraB